MKFNLKQNLLTIAMLSFCVCGLIGCSPAAESASTAEPNKTIAKNERPPSEKNDKYPTTTNRDTGTELKKR